MEELMVEFQNLFPVPSWRKVVAEDRIFTGRIIARPEQQLQLNYSSDRPSAVCAEIVRAGLLDCHAQSGTRARRTL